MSFDVLSFKIVKIHRLSGVNRIKAFVDLEVNEVLLIKGLRVVDGVKGLFVCMPQERGKNQKWYEKVRCLKKEVRGRIDQKVLEAYHKV